MTILQANLKHLYQRKLILLFPLFLITMSVVFAVEVADGYNEGSLLLIGVMIAFMAGCYNAILPINVLTKPFSYCLPGHRTIPAKYSFITGAAICLLFSLPMLFHPDLRFDWRVLLCGTLFFVYSIFYWFGTGIVFRFSSGFNALGFSVWIMLIGNNTDYPVIFERFIFENNVIVVALGLVVNYFAWKLLNNNDLARRYCGKLWVGTFNGWNREKMAKFRQSKLSEKEERKEQKRLYLSPKIEEFFLAKISDSTMGNLAKHIWSGLYRTHAIMLSGRKWFFLVIMPLLVIFLCYMGVGKGMIFIFPAFMAVHLSLGVYSPLLISGGRRERFYSALVLAVTAAMFIVLMLLFASLVSVLLGPIMPTMPFKGQEMIFTPLNWTMSFIPLLMIPIVFTCSHLFPRQKMLSAMLPFMLIMIVAQFSIFMDFTKSSTSVVSSVIVLGIMLSWALFVLVLGYICRRRCLTQ